MALVRFSKAQPNPDEQPPLLMNNPLIINGCSAKPAEVHGARRTSSVEPAEQVGRRVPWVGGKATAGLRTPRGGEVVSGLDGCRSRALHWVDSQFGAHLIQSG